MNTRFRKNNYDTGCAPVIVWLFAMYFFICYITNIVQLISVVSDENESMRHIIIHSIGLIPVASGITVWL